MASVRNRAECLKGWLKERNLPRKKIETVVVFNTEE